MHISVLLATSLTFHFDVDLFLKFIFQPSPALIGGLAITIYASVVSQILGVVIGIFSALAGMARNRAVAEKVAATLTAMKADGSYDKLFDKFGLTKAPESTFAIRGPGPQ